MCEITDKNWIKEQYISSQVFHQTPDGRVREIIVRERLKPQILKSFDPMTQKLYRPPPCTNPHKTDCLSTTHGRRKNSATDSRMKDLQEHPAAGKFQPASESIDSPTAAKGFW
jgi:hypothetical protein